MILRATRRRMGRTCSATYTIPIPPSPTRSRMRYGPICFGSSNGADSKGMRAASADRSDCSCAATRRSTRSASSVSSPQTFHTYADRSSGRNVRQASKISRSRGAVIGGGSSLLGRRSGFPEDGDGFRQRPVASAVAVPMSRPGKVLRMFRKLDVSERRQRERRTIHFPDPPA